MKEKLAALEKEALAEIERASTYEQLEQLRVQYLGRHGSLSSLLKELGQVPAEERPQAGQWANRLKEKIGLEISQKLAALQTSVKTSFFDHTSPGHTLPTGKLHPLTQVIEEVCSIFISLGFQIVEGPEIETERHNFDALNIPQSHPSRDSYDTFYLETTSLGRKLLRSQTSTVQIRVMEKQKPPLRIIAPGKVYRPDAVDASHSFMFHQIEGLWVDEDVAFSDLKGILSVFSRKLFGPKTKTRFRPDFFPFTEPSAEMHISCIFCDGKGCRVCAQKGWIEILGAGMVHPNVFRAVKVDPKQYRGFAFGMGVERLAMLKFGVDDIRLFFENDLRFLKQF